MQITLFVYFCDPYFIFEYNLVFPSTNCYWINPVPDFCTTISIHASSFSASSLFGEQIVPSRFIRHDRWIIFCIYFWVSVYIHREADNDILVGFGISCFLLLILEFFWIWDIPMFVIQEETFSPAPLIVLCVFQLLSSKLDLLILFFRRALTSCIASKTWEIISVLMVAVPRRK